MNCLRLYSTSDTARQPSENYLHHPDGLHPLLLPSHPKHSIKILNEPSTSLFLHREGVAKKSEFSMLFIVI